MCKGVIALFILKETRRLQTREAQPYHLPVSPAPQGHAAQEGPQLRARSPEPPPWDPGHTPGAAGHASHQGGG